MWGIVDSQHAEKGGEFWVQGPVSILFRIFRNIVAFPTLLEGFVVAETVGLGTDIRAIFAPHSKVPLSVVRKGYISVCAAGYAKALWLSIANLQVVVWLDIFNK